MKKSFAMALAFIAVGSVAHAVQPTDAAAVDIAEGSGICGGAGVASAYFQADGSVAVVCGMSR
jgi:hypothetical protein